MSIHQQEHFFSI